MTVGSRTYYTLVVSLPPLPHFERAERLPITRYRLDQRLRMLEAEDARQLSAAEALIGWRPEGPLAKTDEEIYRMCRAMIDRPLHPALREIIDFRMDQRTVVAGLRRKQSRMGLPSGGQAWGAGRWVRWIEEHWDDPVFRLGSIVPWISEARNAVESGEAIHLERLLMNDAWQRLSRIADSNPFGFEAVIAYVFRWDILKSWLAHDGEVGKKKFQELIEEVMDGQHG